MNIKLFDGDPPTFEAALRLEGMTLPPEGLIYVEAEAGRWSARFPWGTVSAPTPAPVRELRDPTGEAFSFRVKVVAPPGHKYAGRLLAEADGIRPSDARGERQSILPVRSVELGEQIWRVSVSETGPVLQVNKLIPGILERVKSEKLFFTLVFPEVVRQVLARVASPDDPGLGELSGWRADWKAFGQRCAGSELPHWNPEAEDESRGEREQWIEAAVSGFCKMNQIRRRFEHVVVTDEEGDER